MLGLLFSTRSQLHSLSFSAQFHAPRRAFLVTIPQAFCLACLLWIQPFRGPN